jgi:hypothetical protein
LRESNCNFAGNHPEHQKRRGDANASLSEIHFVFSRPDLQPPQSVLKGDSPAATSRVQFKNGRSTIRDYEKRRSFSRKTLSNISRRIMGRRNSAFAAANAEDRWFSLA